MIRILQATCESRLFFYIYPTLIRPLSPSTLIRISLFFEPKEFKEFREQCLFIPASLNLKHSSMHSPTVMHPLVLRLVHLLQ